MNSPALLRPRCLQPRSPVRYSLSRHTADGWQEVCPSLSGYEVTPGSKYRLTIHPLQPAESARWQLLFVDEPWFIQVDHTGSNPAPEACFKVQTSNWEQPSWSGVFKPISQDLHVQVYQNESLRSQLTIPVTFTRPRLAILVSSGLLIGTSGVGIVLWKLFGWLQFSEPWPMMLAAGITVALVGILFLWLGIWAPRQASRRIARRLVQTVEQELQQSPLA